MEKAKAIEMLQKHGVKANKFWSEGKIKKAVDEVHKTVASARLAESWKTRKAECGRVKTLFIVTGVRECSQA